MQFDLVLLATLQRQDDILFLSFLSFGACRKMLRTYLILLQIRNNQQ